MEEDSEKEKKEERRKKRKKRKIKRIQRNTLEKYRIKRKGAQRDLSKQVYIDSEYRYRVIEIDINI